MIIIEGKVLRIWNLQVLEYAVKRVVKQLEIAERKHKWGMVKHLQWKIDMIESRIEETKQVLKEG